MHVENKIILETQTELVSQNMLPIKQDIPTDASGRKTWI